MLSPMSIRSIPSEPLCECLKATVSVIHRIVGVRIHVDAMGTISQTDRREPIMKLFGRRSRRSIPRSNLIGATVQALRVVSPHVSDDIPSLVVLF